MLERHAIASAAFENNADGPVWTQRNADRGVELALCHDGLVRIVEARRPRSLRRDGEKSVNRQVLKRLFVSPDGVGAKPPVGALDRHHAQRGKWVQPWPVPLPAASATSMESFRLGFDGKLDFGRRIGRAACHANRCLCHGLSRPNSLFCTEIALMTADCAPSLTASFRASWKRVRASSRCCRPAFCRGSRTSSVCVRPHRALP